MGGRNKDSLVNLEEESAFDIIVNDADGDKDNVTAILERNDNGLFALSSLGEGLFHLHFSGSKEKGTFKAQVTITDGLSPILFTSTVEVASTAKPTTTPTTIPCPPIPSIKSKKSKIKKSSCKIQKIEQSKMQKSNSKKIKREKI